MARGEVSSGVGSAAPTRMARRSIRIRTRINKAPRNNSTTPSALLRTALSVDVLRAVRCVLRAVCCALLAASYSQ
eukprot:7007961-Alexandrium_andersonii.AAC.1